MVEEARLAAVDSGLTPVSEGWFVVNAGDAVWLNNDYFGGVCIFESDGHVLRGHDELTPYEKPGAGFTVRVFSPGQPAGLYHAESDQQEDFLVVMGECILLVEEQERLLRTWDYVHCPAGTAHTFIGAGDGPCVLVGAGNRTDDSVTVRPHSELALRYGAGVKEETTRFPHEKYGPWRHARPAHWDELPWA
jgi:uncharacterized cupin superfamily protein